MFVKLFAEKKIKYCRIVAIFVVLVMSIKVCAIFVGAVHEL